MLLSRGLVRTILVVLFKYQLEVYFTFRVLSFEEKRRTDVSIFHAARDKLL